jgi:gamma-glutamyltranspeptidase/glutathione hydrolase
MAGMVVAPEPLAVEAGALALKSGGNAIDAAVVTAFVQSVVNPHNCGVAGYALLTLHLADRDGQQPPSLVLDAPALGGSLVKPDMWADRVLRANPDGRGHFLEGKPNDLGYTSICTPGTTRALQVMLDRWGTISWEQAIAPATRIADEGFMVEDTLARSWRRKPASPEASSLLELVKSNPEARRIYLKPDGEPYDAGDLLGNPDYASTLRRLASAGASDFYTGDLAREITDDLAANGSYITPDEFASYDVRYPSPLQGSFCDYTIVGAPSPHGGPTLIEALNILEEYDLEALGHNSADYIHLVSMAMKAAFADRNTFIGDPYLVDVPEEELVSKTRAAAWRTIIDKSEAIEVTKVPLESTDTTHLCVVDGVGNCVTLTHTLSASSGVITPGLGFMYNNGMFNFNPLPHHPNAIGPRKGRVTGQTPTIVYRDEKPVLVIGAPGGSRIITGVLQVILNKLVFDMTLTDAVLAPRFDCQLDTIRCEMSIPEYVCEIVRRRHPIIRVPYSHGGFSFVHAIEVQSDGGLRGAADSGWGGMALSA